MFSCGDRLLRAPASLGPWLALLALLTGCYAQHPCVDEVCNGVDDDCDGRSDEGFADADGRYLSRAHCGGCQLDCDDVYPTALETRCELDAEGRPVCALEACAPGERITDQGACAADMPALCLPCAADADCALRMAGARCLPDASGAGRCGEPCAAAGDCPMGFRCYTEDARQQAQCVPASGTCTCAPERAGATLACELRAGDARCPGVRECTAAGLAECEALLDEVCNGVDDDCDGRADEGFTDSTGRYLSIDHCGACAEPCVEPGPHTLVACVPEPAGGARCDVTCAPGFVDVDGLRATGCECELVEGASVMLGADGDCDGEVDETPEFIFVSQRGDDRNDGEELASPVRTIQRGLERGKQTGRTVLVARGIYQGPFELVDGVALLGGYSNDFTERDVELHPVLLELGAAEAAGSPVLRCHGIVAPTVVSGFTVVASDAASPGEGSTAILLDGCGEGVELSQLTVLAARGAAGRPGADSSALLAEWGLGSLSQLAGRPGQRGVAGNPVLEACPPEVPASPGLKVCQRTGTTTDVSGGAGGPGACPDLSLLCQNGSTLPCANAGCTDFTVAGVCDIDAVLSHPSARPNPLAGDGVGPAPGAGGRPSFNSPSNRGDCFFCDDNPSVPRSGGGGEDGTPGADGSAGPGCDASRSVDLARGRVGAGRGAAGAAGSDGSGGGGGSAGAGFAVIGNTLDAGIACSDAAGGGGGGGGSGGCGAPGATGGEGGGSSVAVLLRPPITGVGPGLSRVRLVTASGGDGGDGGIGAAGGPGGGGGLGGGSNFWCARNGGRGGDGGRGGHGGGGGGGCGGGSYGVYVVGAPDTAYLERLEQGVAVERAGVPGRAGVGGFSPGASGGRGLPGLARDVFVD